MNVIVKIDGQVYAVEIEDLQARPVIAVVEGERMEIWVEQGAAHPAPAPAAERPAPGVVRAPLPGVILSIAARAGQTVALGDELCVIEAMKMKNPIRAGRAGTIRAVPISVGQQVRHGDVLVEYEGVSG
jgi:biotin carboxyl carrier protein